MQTQKEFVNNLSDKGKKIVQDNPQKKRETLEKLRAVGDKWKRVHRLATEKKDYLIKCIAEVETFEVKYNECMEVLEKFSNDATEMNDTDKDLSHVESSVDEVLRVGLRISYLLPESEREILEARLEKLRVTWKEMCGVREESARVQEREVIKKEKAKSLNQENQDFLLEVSEFSSWLKEAESTLQIDMFSVPEEEQMDVIRKQEKLYNEIQQHSLLVNDIMTKGKKISARMNEEERASIKEQLEDLSSRWDKVRTLSDLQGDEIERCIGEQTDYYEQLETCVLWMQEASATIAADGAHPSDIEGIKAELGKHRELCQELTRREEMVQAVMEKGKNLCEKIPPEERAAVMEQLTRVKDEWSKLQYESKEKEKELRRCLGETVEDVEEDDENMVEDVKSFCREVGKWSEWVEALMTRAENSEEMVVMLSEIENHYNDLEATIVKGEEMLDKMTATPDRERLETFLLQLKQGWKSLKMKAGCKRRRQGRLGSELERKNVLFVVTMSELKGWLMEARERANQIHPTSVQSIEGLEEALKVCCGVKNEFLEKKAAFEELMLTGKEIAARWESENLGNEEVVTGQMDGLKTEWGNFRESMEKQANVLQDAITQAQQLESDFGIAERSLVDAQFRLNNISNEDEFEAVESELQSLQGLLCDVEMCEAEIASIEAGSQMMPSSCQAIQDAFNTRVCELTEKLLNVKESISRKIQQDQETLDQREQLVTELLECKGLINKVENSANEELKMENIPLLEEGVVFTKEALSSTENALASVHTKTGEILSKLKPAEQSALQAEVNDLRSQWEYVGENTCKRVENLEKRIASCKDFGRELENCNEWIVKATDEISRSEFVSGDVASLEEHVASLKTIIGESKSSENVVNLLLAKSDVFLKDIDDMDKEMYESQVAKLKSSVKEVEERSAMEIAKLQERINESKTFQEAYQELKSWVESELIETCSEEVQSSSVEERLKELELRRQLVLSKESELKLLLEKAEKLLNNADEAENETFQYQLSNLQSSYKELKRKVDVNLSSLQGEHEKGKEFEAELRQCRNIVQEIENTVLSETPCFTDIEEMEAYVEELKKKFEDALSQRSLIFSLSEKKDQISTSKDATDGYSEVVDKWKMSLARFSEKIADTERRIALEKELNDSCEDVISWIDNVEKEISCVSDHAQEKEEVVEQVERLKSLSNECASYEQMMESLRGKVENSPLESNEGFQSAQEGRLSSLEARFEEMHRRLAAKLGDVEHCVTDLSDVTEQISSCKEWLLQKKELIANDEQVYELGNVPQLEEKLFKYQNLSNESATALDGITQAKVKVGQGIGKVSTAIEDSLSKELNSLCDTLTGLHEESSAKCVELEKHLREAKEFQDKVTHYENWLHQANDVLQKPLESPVSLNTLAEHLNELRYLQTDMDDKQEEFRSFLERNKDLVARSGVQVRLVKASEKFEYLNKELPQLLKETEAKINEYTESKKQLEESQEWLSSAAQIVDSDIMYSLDDTRAEKQYAELKDLLPKIESFEAVLTSMEEKKSCSDVVEERDDSNLQGKLDSLRKKWETLREVAVDKEETLLAFLQARDNYQACSERCQVALDELKNFSVDGCQYSADKDNSNVQLEKQRQQVKKCQELEEQIRLLEEEGDHVSSRCEELRGALQDKLKEVKDEWQNISADARIRYEQLESWICEVGDIHCDVDVCLARVKALHESLQNCDSEGTDIQTANEILGQLKQAASELESEKANVDSLVEKWDVLLTRVDSREKPQLENSIRELQTAMNEAAKYSKERVHRAEERITNIIELDKESARCESLLTIYQAAVPVDVSCTVETLEDQMEKLKRLYGDMESRDNHMTALQEKEAKLISDEINQSGGSNPDAKIGNLQGDWGKLKASVGEKLRELERLAQTKKDFEDDYNTCQEGIKELEAAIIARDNDRGSVEERVERMQELCSRIKSYRNKLDLLTDRCDELPNVAYDQKDLDPRRKLAAVVRRWEEVKAEALGKLNALEKEKAEIQKLAQDTSNLQCWVQDVCSSFIHKDLPPVVQMNELESALMANTELRSILEAKYKMFQELLAQCSKIKGEGQRKETVLTNLQEISSSLKGLKEKFADRDAEIKSRCKQHAKLVTDLDRTRDLLMEVKSQYNPESVDLESENWIEEGITSRRVALVKLDSCKLLLVSMTDQIAKESPERKEIGENAIAKDIRELTEDVHVTQQQLGEEIIQLEKLQDFDNECIEQLALYKNLFVKLGNIDLDVIAKKGEVEQTEQELVVCQAVDQEVSERERDYEALIGNEDVALSFAPQERKEEIRTRFRQMNDTRISLKELISKQIDELRNLVAEQQTLEGWLKTAGNLVADAVIVLEENQGSQTLDSSQMSERLETLAAHIAKIDEYLKYGGSFQGWVKAPEVAKAKARMSELKQQLQNADNDCKHFKENCELFESEAREAAVTFERCATEHQVPVSLQEAQEKLENLKVSKYQIKSIVNKSSISQSSCSPKGIYLNRIN